MRVPAFVPAAGLAASLAVALAVPAIADDDGFPGTYSFSGYIRAQYGNGDRFGEDKGEDSLGIQQGVLIGKWLYKNLEGVLLLGGVNLTGDDFDQDGDFGIKDAFIIWRQIGGSDLGLSAGVQPLFFGLKPNGFPGDRSLQASLEFGGAGGFAVAQQAGPSVILFYEASDRLRVEGGFFDTSSSTAAYHAATGLGDIDGSTLDSNYFFQIKVGDPGTRGSGFYGVVGFEERYVGDAVDSSEPIFDVGVGYHHEGFDLSVELIDIDQDLTGTVEDETYLVAELTVHLGESSSFLLDYAEADVAEIETLRAGFKHQVMEPLTFHLEYSEDDFTRLGTTVESVDARLTLSF